MPGFSISFNVKGTDALSIWTQAQAIAAAALNNAPDLQIQVLQLQATGATANPWIAAVVASGTVEEDS